MEPIIEWVEAKDSPHNPGDIAKALWQWFPGAMTITVSRGEFGQLWRAVTVHRGDAKWVADVLVNLMQLHFPAGQAPERYFTRDGTGSRYEGVKVVR